jgi:micrococcal nuclease
MVNPWRRFRAMPGWAQVPIGLVVGFFALTVVTAPFIAPEDGQDVVSRATTTVPATTSTTLPATTTSTLPPLPAGEDTAVERITDGDSLVVADDTRIRLIGVDAPEVESDDCFSAEATDHLTGLIGPGTRVRLVYDVDRLDGYGRTLAYVYRLPDGLFVNLTMAGDGFAQQLTIPPNVRHTDDFGRAVTAARAADRGLWSACGATTTIAPGTTRDTAPAAEVDAVPGDGIAAEPPTTAAQETGADEPAGVCHPSYRGACVPIASDVDCGRGSGNGPAYVYETDIEVIGPDVYGLDGSDNDGIGCES